MAQFPAGLDADSIVVLRERNDSMFEFSIRCHRAVPLEATELEDWLDARAAELRAAWPTATIRLFRLTQPLSSESIDVGWLLEAAIPADESDVEGWLAETLRDMRLLGFQPVLFGRPVVLAGA